MARSAQHRWEEECGVQLGFVGMFRTHSEESNEEEEVEEEEERLGCVGVGVEVLHVWPDRYYCAAFFFFPLHLNRREKRTVEDEKQQNKTKPTSEKPRC